MAGVLRETYTAEVMVLEDLTADPDLVDVAVDAVGILEGRAPGGITEGDGPTEITEAILQALQVDKAEQAILEAYPGRIEPEDYPEAVALALSYFRGL